MRVLLLAYVFSDVGDTGEVRIVWESARALAEQGIEVFVATNYCRIESPLPPNIKVYKVPFGKFCQSFSREEMLKSFLFCLPLIFLKKIDIIHLISTNSPCPFSRFKVRPFAVGADFAMDYDNPKYGKDLLYDRSKKGEEFKAVRRIGLLSKLWSKITVLFFKIFKLDEDLPREVDLYICRNRELLEKLKRENYKSKLIFVPHGANLDLFHPGLEPARKKSKNFVFLFVGKISKRKGVEYLIKAFNRLHQGHKNTELLLAGGGAPSTEEDFKKLAGPGIEFLGRVPSDQISGYYVHCDVLVQPSFSESCSLVGREAMACAKPVIGTRASGFLDLIEDGKTGLLIEPADEEDLFKAMEKLLLSKGLAVQLGRNSLAYIKKELTWDSIAKKLIAGYKSLYGEN